MSLLTVPAMQADRMGGFAESATVVRRSLVHQARHSLELVETADGVGETSDADRPRRCDGESMLGQLQLTERERVAAVMLAYGHTNRDVAHQLQVSVRTVESERARLMRKLGFQHRAELVRWAIEHGFLR
jgi:DNA-binding NarL/FixJ family response regulator